MLYVVATALQFDRTEPAFIRVDALYRQVQLPLKIEDIAFSMLHSHSIIMRVFISGVKGVDGLHETRACLLLVLVLICSIDRSNSRGK